MICLNCSQEFTARRTDAKLCGQCRVSRSGDYWTKDYKWRLSKLLAASKNRSKFKSLPYDIDLEYLLELWEKTTVAVPSLEHRLI